MARWVALFRDDPSADWVRKKHSQEHFDYLAAHSDKIKIGGGLRPSPDEWFCGGLRVLEVSDQAEAVRLVEEDPYFKLGLRTGYELFVWGKAPFYGAVTL